MGKAIAESDLQLWCGAVNTGLMRELAGNALEAGGDVYSVFPKIFNTPLLVHNGLTKFLVVKSMHQS